MRALASVLLIGTLWGLNWPAVKFMLTQMPPLTIRAVAFPLAACLLALLATTKGQSMRLRAGDRVAMIITGLLLIFGFNVLTTLGQLLTETSQAAIIAYTMPALTVCLATFFLNERLTVIRGLALALGMAGLFVLASQDFIGLAANPSGPLIMLMAALSWALGTVALKARAWQIEPLPLTAWFFVVSSLACWPLVWWLEPPGEQRLPSASVMLVMAFHVLGPMLICYALWTNLVSRVPASVAALSVLLAPVVGVSSAIVLLGESLTLQKLLALLLIVGSVALTLRSQGDP